MNFTLNRLILFSLTILLILAVTILGLTFLTKNSLQDRFNLLGNGSVTRLINYIDKYVFIGTIELPSDTEYLFNYFSNKDGYIAFYQVVHRLDLNRSDPSNDQAKAYEECETKFPPVPLELHKPEKSRGSDSIDINSYTENAHKVNHPHRQFTTQQLPLNYNTLGKT